MKSNDIVDSNTFAHNHNYLMGTITFEVHNMTPTSPRNTLATILKCILILFTFHVLCIFFFQAYHAWAYGREKRKYPIM